MVLDDEVWLAISDRLEGWELVEFLQVSIQDILLSGLENDWINNNNIEDVLELVGLKEENEQSDVNNYD